MECPTCKADMLDDGVNAWCVQADCSSTKTIPLAPCKTCGDTGKIIEPAHWPEGLSLKTHTWDQLRKMALPGREFACPDCSRGKLVAMKEKLEPYDGLLQRD